MTACPEALPMEKPYWVVSWQAGGLVGCQICEVDPVPGGYEDILRFDVPMADTSSMALSQTLQQLKCDPSLHNHYPLGSLHAQLLTWIQNKNRI